MAISETLFQLQTSYLNKSTIIALTLFFTLLCACIVIGHLLEGFTWANESIASLLLGMAAGLVVLFVNKGMSSKILAFNEDLFFIYMLPPIIFNAGFQVKKKQFFHNFSTILTFAVLGTLISFCVISSGAYLIFSKFGFARLSFEDFLAIGAILSSTDSVCTLQVLNQEKTPFLYSIVFGEGVVNDATSIVLFNAAQSLDGNFTAFTALKLLGIFLYLFFTSTILGIVVGLLSAFVIKKLYFGRHSTDREIAVMLLMAYLSYMLAEIVNLSGILTVFFCGIFMSHYTWHNVTESSRITTKHSFATISFIAETFIFLYVGMDALNVEKWKESKASARTSVSISFTMLSLVLVGRAAFVFPLANISNFFKKGDNTKIELRQQFVIWWAGLMRGAITVALSYNQFSVGKGEEGALMITSTIIVVLFSTMVFGSITKPLIEALLLQNAGVSPTSHTSGGDFTTLEDLQQLFLEDEGEMETTSNRKASNFELLMRYPTSTVHYFWRKFDDTWMRPIFGGRGFVPFVPISPSVASQYHLDE